MIVLLAVIFACPDFVKANGLGQCWIQLNSWYNVHHSLFSNGINLEIASVNYLYFQVAIAIFQHWIVKL